MDVSRYTTTGILLAAAALSLFALGCHDTIDEPPLTASTFGANEQKSWAIPSRLEIDSPMVIITRCLPLVEGKGHVVLSGRTSLNGTHWHLLEPVDTVMTQVPPGDAVDVKYQPVLFHANQPLELHWRIQFNSLRTHGFNATFYMDSVYLADGPGMVGLHSPEATAHSGKLYGYDRGDGYVYPPLSINP